MKHMKKSVFAFLTVLMLCCLVVVSVSAIDTPWLPATPDGGSESESVSTDEPATNPTPSNPSETEEPTQTGSGETEEQDTPDAGVSVDSQNGTHEKQTTQSGSTASLEQNSGGCGSAVNGCGLVIAAVCGVWMLCGTKHAKEKEVNG